MGFQRTSKKKKKKTIFPSTCNKRKVDPNDLGSLQTYFVGFGGGGGSVDRRLRGIPI